MFHGLTRTGKAGHGVCGPSSTPSASCQRSWNFWSCVKGWNVTADSLAKQNYWYSY
jgi:hypothetical protein